jgi:hypothetical protein
MTDNPMFVLDKFYNGGILRRDLSKAEFEQWKEIYNKYLMGCPDYICSDNNPERLCGIDTTCPTHSTYESYKDEIYQCTQLTDTFGEKMEGFDRNRSFSNKEVFDHVYKNSVYTQAPNFSCLSCAGKMNYCINQNNKIVYRSWCKILNDYWVKNNLANSNSLLDRSLERHVSKDMRALLATVSEKEVIDFEKEMIKGKVKKNDKK